MKVPTKISILRMFANQMRQVSTFQVERDHALLAPSPNIAKTTTTAKLRCQLTSVVSRPGGGVAGEVPVAPVVLGRVQDILHICQEVVERQTPVPSGGNTLASLTSTQSDLHSSGHCHHLVETSAEAGYMTFIIQSLQ